MKISRYSFLIASKDGFYVYNALSNSLLEIDSEAYMFLKRNQENNETVNLAILDDLSRDLLIDNKIITENDEDDFLIYKSSILNLRAQNEGMHLTIAPTMNCCFNCHYCFEKVKGGNVMSEQTMDAILKFVMSHKSLKHLRLTWFGGEPLMAVDAIALFYNKLKNLLPQEIAFSSNIITTGYHLDKKAVQILDHAKVSSMQITLDGLKDTHNKVKHLSECDDVFSKVINNIYNASNWAPHISIVIRVNLTKDNAREYPELCNLLSRRFNGLKNISISPAFVLDRSATPTKCALFTRSSLTKYLFELVSNNIDSPFFRYPKSYFSECAIRNANAVSFDPEGYAYKCWENIGNKEYAVWKLNQQGIPEDINRKLYNRHMYGADPLDDPICSKCKYLPICAGGCPIQRIENKFEGHHNDLCTYYKGCVDKFIQIHIERKKSGFNNY